jgi:hypothetical protein
MPGCRFLISALMILAMLAGNVAAVRHGCCQLGPLAAQCCCHRPAARCPRCPAPPKESVPKDDSTPKLAKSCRCPKHEAATAVVEPTVRLKQELAQATVDFTSTATPQVTLDSRVAVLSLAPFHPPRYSIAAWQCSWQA